MAEHCCYCWSPGHHCARVALCENHARGEAREDRLDLVTRAERAEAEAETLRAEVERLNDHILNTLRTDASEAEFQTDRAEVAESRINAARRQIPAPEVLDRLPTASYLVVIDNIRAALDGDE